MRNMIHRLHTDGNGGVFTRQADPHPFMHHPPVLLKCVTHPVP
jgi:hypothetical protein